MKTSMLIKQLSVAGLVAAMAALVPVASQAATGKTIRVLSASGVDASTPDAAVWQKAPVTQVALQPAFAGHPSVVGVPATTQIAAQAIRAGNQLFVKLVWSDATANAAIKDIGQFMDGAAVQFPVNGKAATTPFMGDANNAVNVWRWRADGLTENMIAKGYGTSTTVSFEALHSASARTENGWAVVLARPLKVSADEGASLANRKTMPIAFAAWDGANQERDGFKAVTLEWWQLKF